MLLGRRAALALLTAVALVALGCGSAESTATSAEAAGKPKVYPIPKPQMPSASEGCEAGTTENGVTTIPIKVAKVRQLVEPVVNMCFDGKGPYPMLIDTGASASVISISLAKELGLKKVGTPSTAEGAGCTTKTQSFELPSWSLGGLDLEPAVITAVQAPEKGKGYARGSLGADVLSRFGAARLDFKRETLTLAGEEGPSFTGSKKAAKTPGALLKGRPKFTIPMQVQSEIAGLEVIQTVKVGVGQTKPLPWLIDTGAAFSFVDAGLVAKAKLRATGTAQKGSTYCSIITVTEYKANSLPLSSGKLRAQTVGSQKGLRKAGVGGILGSYALWQFGSVVFDWGGGKLLLGAG